MKFYINVDLAVDTLTSRIMDTQDVADEIQLSALINEVLCESARANEVEDLIALIKQAYEGAGLRDNEKRVIKAKYLGETGMPLTLEATGKELGITRERVRIVEEKAISKMRQYISVENATDRSLYSDIFQDLGNIILAERIFKS